MANPLISLLGLGQTKSSNENIQNGSMANLNQVLGLYNLVKGSNNPMETLKQMAQTNPQIAQTLAYIQSNGGNMNQIAENLANQAGVSLPLLKGLFG